MARLLTIFIAVFVLGIFAASFWASFYLGLFFIFLGLVFLVLSKIGQVGRYLISTACLVCLAFGFGIFYYSLRAQPPDLSFLENKIDSRVVFLGIIVDEPDQRENHTKLVLQTEESSAKILITAQHYPKFQYGDKVKVVGVLKRPKNFSEDFDWLAYLAKDDIFFEMFYPEIELISGGQSFLIKRPLFSLKEKFLSSVSRSIPEPHSALLGGLVFGAKRSMPAELLEDFRRTGIIHIVVLSGYNITIVADAIMRVLSFFPHFLGIAFGILGIIAFAVMTGASATIVRAAIMAILVLLARATGRIYHVTLALFLAGFLMILHNPKIVRFDSSFQLSFLATLALIYLVPILEPRLKFLPQKLKIRELATATLATQLFVLPLLLYKMGLFSVVSLPVNLLILIFVPATMFFGFVTSFLGFLSFYLSIPFAWITYALLAYELKIVEFFAGLPFAAFTVSSFPAWLMLLVYLGYAILIFKYGFRKKTF